MSASWRRLGVLFVLFLLNVGLLHFATPPLGRLLGYDGEVDLFELDSRCLRLPLAPTCGLAAEHAHDFIARLGPSGRSAAIAAHAAFDLSFPIIYWRLTATAIALGWPAWPLLDARRATLVPLGCALADLFENLGIVLLALLYPTRPDALAVATSALTLSKSALAVPTVLMSVAALASAIVRPRAPR